MFFSIYCCFIANANILLQGDELFPIINSVCQLHVKIFCVLKKNVHLLQNLLNMKLCMLSKSQREASDSYSVLS